MLSALLVLPAAQRLRVVFVAPSYVGGLKPAIYNSTQGNGAVLAFTRHLRGFCGSHGIALIDPFEPSRGAHSFDGTHYGLEFNVLLAQLVLNVLRFMKGGR